MAELILDPYPLGKREVTADFVGPKTANLSLLKRPDALTFDYLTAFTLGPRTIGDTEHGILDRPWYARVDNVGKRVMIARADDTNTMWEAEVELFSFVGADIEEVDFAFEQQSRPVVCAERNTGVDGAKEIWLYWYNPLLPGFEFVMFDSGRTPRTLLDNPPDLTNSDVQVFYLKTGVGLVYRQQRDRYAVVIDTPHIEEPDWYLEDVFYTNNWRVGLVLVRHNADGSYTKRRMETSLMPVFLPQEDKVVMFAPELSEGQLRVALFLGDGSDEMVLYAPSLSEGKLAEPIIHTGPEGSDGRIDIDSMVFYAPVLSAGELRDAKIRHTLYDKDKLVFNAPALSNGRLFVALIQHTIYDKDQMVFNAPVLSNGYLGP